MALKTDQVTTIEQKIKRDSSWKFQYANIGDEKKFDQDFVNLFLIQAPSDH